MRSLAAWYAAKRYAGAQLLGFAGMVIATLLCTTGFIAPFWQEGYVSVSSFTDILGFKSPFLGQIELVKINGGLWWYCMETEADESQCRGWDFEGGYVKDWVIRAASVVNIALCLVLAVTALTRALCCGSGRTVCDGIAAFIAGAAGIVVVAIYGSIAEEDGYTIKLGLAKLGWAFYVYAVGSGLVVVVSFLLCFAPPKIASARPVTTA